MAKKNIILNFRNLSFKSIMASVFIVTFYCSTRLLIDSLPNNKIVDWSNLKAFADDKINVTEKLKFTCFEKHRKHHGKWRKCWLPAFSHFPILFSKGSFFRVIKSQDCVVKSQLFPKQVLLRVYRTNLCYKQFLLFLQCFPQLYL